MQYVDATLVRLADPATRAAVFDQEALGQMLEAAYDTDATPVSGPFSPVFDEFRLALAMPRLGVVEGAWGVLGGIERSEARFQLAGVGSESAARVDALWRGRIAAQLTPATGRISAVRSVWPDLGGVDAAITADLGALPTDPAALEQARRAEISARVRAELDQPQAFDADSLERWLAGLGVRSAGELLRAGGAAAGGVTQVTYSPPNDAPAVSMGLPVTAALLIRDAGFSLAALLAESALVREQLIPQGLERPADPALPRRQSLLVVWVLPLAVFDDGDWPGGAAGSPDARRAPRRQAAGRWLAREGIALAATP
jgi:hypothetical protein